MSLPNIFEKCIMMNKFLQKKQLKLELFHEGYVFKKMWYLLQKMSYGSSKISALRDEIRDPWRN